MLLRRMFIMLGLTLSVVLGLAAYKGFSIYQQIQMFSAPQPAISVSAHPAESLPWQGRLPAIGSLRALQGIDLTVEVSGTVRELLFDSGAQVRAGQPLLQMDSAVESASLATAEAELKLARVEYQRGQSLIGRQAISKSEYDRLASNLQKAEASVAQLRATLAKKRIVAPFGGTLGIRQVDVGDFLSSGTLIATLQNLDSLYVDFHLPEQSTPLLQVGQPVEVRVAAGPGEAFSGQISAISPKVDEHTRNLQVRAVLANPERRLLPGMFADLDVLLDQQPALVVPETAVTYTLYGNALYVAVEGRGADGQPQLQAERRFIETGERRDGRVQILKGLKAGEQVITSGQLKLDNGAHVDIVEDQAQRLQDATPASQP
ncbi:TPA: efflux RND transporter periplasmic adaptor subunit [Klebsiella pneumoniae]